jgi:hypothetical protein
MDPLTTTKKNEHSNPAFAAASESVAHQNGTQMNGTKMEEPYSEQSEKLLKHWWETADQEKNKHYRKGKRCLFLHRCFAFPSVAIPAIYAPISGLFREENGIQIANAVIFALVALLSSVYTFWDFGTKSNKHFEYEAKYADICSTINVELVKQPKYRIPADRFVEMIQGKIDAYKAHAPLI